MTISAELLEKGAAYIEEHGLYQGHFWPNWKDTPRSVALAEGLPACGLGALRLAFEEVRAFISADVYFAARDALNSFHGGSFPGWNDAPGRTAAEVADAMRKTAATLREAS